MCADSRELSPCPAASASAPGGFTSSARYHTQLTWNTGQCCLQSVWLIPQESSQALGSLVWHQQQPPLPIPFSAVLHITQSSRWLLPLISSQLDSTSSVHCLSCLQCQVNFEREVWKKIYSIEKKESVVFFNQNCLFQTCTQQFQTCRVLILQSSTNHNEELNIQMSFSSGIPLQIEAEQPTSCGFI